MSDLNLVPIQIDGLHLDDHLLMIGAVGIEVSGQKHPPGVVEGATGNAAAVQAVLDNLIERGLDPEGCYLFIVDGAGRSAKRRAGPLARIFRSNVAKSTRRATSLTALLPGITPPWLAP